MLVLCCDLNNNITVQLRSWVQAADAEDRI